MLSTDELKELYKKDKQFKEDVERLQSWCDIGFTVDDFRFCPNCGTPMFEPQESEVEE